jgi:hypothetical protein
MKPLVHACHRPALSDVSHGSFDGLLRCFWLLWTHRIDVGQFLPALDVEAPSAYTLPLLLLLLKHQLLLLLNESLLLQLLEHCLHCFRPIRAQRRGRCRGDAGRLGRVAWGRWCSTHHIRASDSSCLSWGWRDDVECQDFEVSQLQLVGG